MISRCSGAPMLCAVLDPSWMLNPRGWSNRIGLTRFKLRQATAAEFRVPSPDLIVPNDVLPSVSRRDPRRDGANVWTSGNRIFGCDGTATLATVIDGINAGGAGRNHRRHATWPAAHWAAKRCSLRTQFSTCEM